MGEVRQKMYCSELASVFVRVENECWKVFKMIFDLFIERD